MVMTRKATSTKLPAAGATPAAEDDTKTAAAAETAAEPAKETKVRSAPPEVEDHSDPATPKRMAAAPPAEAPLATTGTTAMAPRAGAANPLAKVSEPVESDGFDDLDGEIGFGSFPILTLANGQFSVGDDEVGTEVDVICQQSRAKHLFKEADEEETDFLVYSYDEVHDASGKLLTDVWAEWEEAKPGIKIEHKKYSEAVALIISDGDYKGQLALLSVPPASLKRFSGYRTELKIMRGGKKLTDVVTRLCLGKLVKTDNNKKFNPWNFKYLRTVTQEDIDNALAGLEDSGEE